jgi:hypothetical protein
MMILSNNKCFETLGILLVAGILLYAVGAAAVKKVGEVLVTTESAPETTDAPSVGSDEHNPMQKRIERDGLKAAAILRKAVCSTTPVSTWAAIYLRRLGVAHDTACARRALTDGADADDTLLQALSWRHLAADIRIALPTWRKTAKRDPAVLALAAIAYAVRGDVPESLKYSLTIPPGKPVGESRKSDVEKRTGHLGAMGLAFDDGPVALAAAFAEMRYEQCVIGKGRKRRFAAEALRETLIDSLSDDPKAVATKLPKQGALPDGVGDVGRLLDNRLVSRSLDTLRAVILTGEISLRREGLRALAVAAKVPVAGDMAASASALVSSEPFVRVEGARTYLLLLKRTR